MACDKWSRKRTDLTSLKNVQSVKTTNSPRIWMDFLIEKHCIWQWSMMAEDDRGKALPREGLKGKDRVVRSPATSSFPLLRMTRDYFGVIPKAGPSYLIDIFCFSALMPCRSMLDNSMLLRFSRPQGFVWFCPKIEGGKESAIGEKENEMKRNLASK